MFSILIIYSPPGSNEWDALAPSKQIQLPRILPVSAVSQLHVIQYLIKY